MNKVTLPHISITLLSLLVLSPMFIADAGTTWTSGNIPGATSDTNNFVSVACDTAGNFYVAWKNQLIASAVDQIFVKKYLGGAIGRRQ